MEQQPELYLLVGLAVYAYYAVMLAWLAAKTATPGAWMAPVPVLNLILFARLAGFPGYSALLVIVPLANIIWVVAGWQRLAERCGRPGWTGAFAIVPLAGMVVPLYLAAGPGRSRGQTAGSRSAPHAPGGPHDRWQPHAPGGPHDRRQPHAPGGPHDRRQPSAPGGQGGWQPSAPRSPQPSPPAVCPACGRVECVSGFFCGYTGLRIRARPSAQGGGTRPGAPPPGSGRLRAGTPETAWTGDVRPGPAHGAPPDPAWAHDVRRRPPPPAPSPAPGPARGSRLAGLVFGLLLLIGIGFLIVGLLAGT